MELRAHFLFSSNFWALSLDQSILGLNSHQTTPEFEMEPDQDLSLQIFLGLRCQSMLTKLPHMSRVVCWIASLEMVVIDGLVSLQLDNFIHADMHPGNILVRANEAPEKGFFKRSRPHVVLLDVGMTVELSQKDRKNLLNFFKAVSLKNGRKVAEYALKFSRAQNCPDPEAFTTVSFSLSGNFDKSKKLCLKLTQQEILFVLTLLLLLGIIIHKNSDLFRRKDEQNGLLQCKPICDRLE